MEWAKAHYASTGRWPSTQDGTVSQSPEETWSAIAQAIRHGYRGLPGGSSLAKLLRKHGLN